MRAGMESFLRQRLYGLRLADGSAPYSVANVFVDDAPRDFFTEHGYGVVIAILPSREKRDGQLTGKKLDAENGCHVLTRRTHSVTILVRVILRAPSAEELQGGGSYGGLVKQLRKAVAAHKGFVDSEGNWVAIEIDESARPWNSGEERKSLLGKPKTAHVRVRCQGGLYETETVGWIPEINITPDVV